MSMNPFNMCHQVADMLGSKGCFDYANTSFEVPVIRPIPVGQR
jgi:hypothetical protein